MTIFLEQALLYLAAYLVITSFCGIFLVGHKLEKTIKVLLGYDISVNQFYTLLRFIIYTIPKYIFVFLLFITPTPMWATSLLFLTFNVHLMVIMSRNYLEVENYIREHGDENVETIINNLTNHSPTHNISKVFIARSIVDFLFFLTLLVIDVHFINIFEIVI